MLPNSQTSAQ